LNSGTKFLKGFSVYRRTSKKFFNSKLIALPPLRATSVLRLRESGIPRRSAARAAQVADGVERGGLGAFGQKGYRKNRYVASKALLTSRCRTRYS
jgi:hypothetical protein